MAGRAPGLIAVVICGLLLAFTGNKLHTMAQVRGWVAGRTLVQAPVTSKRATEDPSGRTVFHVAWAQVPGVQETGTNVSEELYDELEAHASTLELATVGERTYVVRGIYASDGNVGFDVVLLTLWLVGLGWGAVRLARGGPAEAPLSPTQEVSRPGALAGGRVPEGFWPAATGSGSWVLLALRLVGFGTVGFVVGCVVAIEGFGLVPAPWTYWTPTTLIALAAGWWTYVEPWDELVLDGQELRWSRDGEPPQTWSPASVALIVGEHGFDLEQQNPEGAFFIWRHLRLVGEEGQERIDILPAYLASAFAQLRERCPGAVAISADGEVHAGPEAAPQTKERALRLLRRRWLKAALIVVAALAVAVAVVVALVLGETDPSALMLTVFGALTAFAYGRQGLANLRAHRRARAALRSR